MQHLQGENLVYKYIALQNKKQKKTRKKYFKK